MDFLHPSAFYSIIPNRLGPFHKLEGVPNFEDKMLMSP